MSETLESPVFIVGPLRAGTTLLRLLLGHHSSISGIGEFEYAVSQANGNQWPSIETYHAFLKNDRMFQDHGHSVDTSLDYEALVHSFLAQAWEKNPKPIVSAAVHSRFDLLPRLWPKARFIHILRDPRDVARSCIGMGWVGNVYAGSEYWQAPESRWDDLTADVPHEQRFQIRYEELVANPQKVLTEICDYLDLQYEPEMTQLEKDTTYSAPDPAYKEQWRQKLSDREIELVEFACSPLMAERGYQLIHTDPRGPSALEKAQLTVQNRWYRWSFNINRWGFGLWLEHHIAKRLGPVSWRERTQRKINDIARRHLK